MAWKRQRDELGSLDQLASKYGVTKARLIFCANALIEAENGKGEAAHNDTPRNDTPFGEGRDATSKPIVPNANGANPAHGESPAQQ